MSYDESKARDVLFLIDGSRSMGGKLRSAGMSKMKLVKEGLMGFVSEHWPVSYFPWPIRMGVTFYRLLGTPGSMHLEEVVPLNPAPASLELYRIDELGCKGGSPLVEAIRYGVGAVADSMRKEKVVKLISDGGNDGAPVKTIAAELKDCGVTIDVIELSNSASKELREVASLGHGKYTRPNSLDDFAKAIRR